MTRKTPKCSIGFPCGKSCINRNNQCWANLSTTNNRVAETFSQFLNRLVGIGTSTQSVINYNNSNSIVIENLPNRIKKPTEYQEKKLEEFFKIGNYWKEKLNKVRVAFPDLSIKEAMGIALWISDEYTSMNNKLWKNYSDEELVKLEQDPIEAMYFAANYYAYKAIISNKLPKYNRNNMQKDLDIIYQNNSSNNKKPQLSPNAKLFRGLEFLPDGVEEQLLNYYTSNIGNTVKENVFFATTALEPSDFLFTKKAPIVFEITPKENSNGAMVDRGKNQLFEGEVLYAPGQNFKVIGVEKNITRSKNPNVTLEYLDKLVEYNIPSKIKQILNNNQIPNYEIIKIVESFTKRMDYNMDLNKFIKEMLFIYPYLTKELISQIYSLKSEIDPEIKKEMDYINFNGGISISKFNKILLEEV